MWGDYVGKKSLGHAAWFKLYANQHGAVLNAVSDADAGHAVKAALRYLETGTLPTGLQGPVAVVFAALRPSVDEAALDYRRKSEGGKAGNRKRWQGLAPAGIGVRHQPIPSDRMVSHGIEKIEDRRNNTDASAVPGLGAGEQQNAYKDLFLDPESGEWRRRSNE